MDGNFAILEKQIRIINTIVASTNEMLPVLKENENLDETIHQTIEQIFVFLGTILKVMPDMLLSSKDLSSLKENIIGAYYAVRVSWENYPERTNDFFDSWEEFIISWSDFVESIEKLDNDGNQINLSMN